MPGDVAVFCDVCRNCTGVCVVSASSRWGMVRSRGGGSERGERVIIKGEPATLADPSALRRSRTEAVARYTIQDRIASGGMGVVYRVIDPSTGEICALKRMSPDMARRPLMVEAFEREYHVLASIDHPRIIRVFDYDVDEDGPYYTMEFLEGDDMRRVAPLPYRDACRTLRDVAMSLALLHARRLIHRDLSPTNIRMTADGHCKLLDFGALASFGNAPVIVGTPPAVAPEVFFGLPLDQRTDLYALGALAYWMITGRHAYPARRIEELPALWGRPPASPAALVPGVPRELEELVLSLLSADPLARPASAAEVILRLSVIGQLPQEDDAEIDRIAESFLLSPRFTARAEEIGRLESSVREAIDGHGAAIRLEAVSGMGRTRLLEELGVRARIEGAAVVRIDASMHRTMLGTIRAITARLFDAFPELARGLASRFGPALSTLGKEIEARLPAPVSGARASQPEGGSAPGTLGSGSSPFVV
jgi:hypothetical protein